MPGRLVGATVDRDGSARLRAHAADARAAHPPREGDLEHLHQRRAVRADGHDLPRHRSGKQGLVQVGELSTAKAHYAAERLAQVPGVSLRFAAPFFKEFTLSCRSRPTAWSRGSPRQGILAGVPLKTLRPRARRLPAGGGDREADEATRSTRSRRRSARRWRDAHDSQRAYDQLIFELSSPGRMAFSLPECRRAGRPTLPTLVPARLPARATPPRCRRSPSSTWSATSRACRS